MNRKISIYTLKDCSVCESLKLKLISNNIQFNDICCSEDSNICNTIENLTNCDMYPIVQIELSISKNIVLCLAKKHSQINANIVTKSYVLFYVYSIDNMIDAIKNM